MKTVSLGAPWSLPHFVSEPMMNSMASASEAIEAVFLRSTPDALKKWQVIQNNLPALPENALRDLMAELTRTLVAEESRVTEAVLQVIEDWYRRALFAGSRMKGDPVDPVLTIEQWEALPDRWFEGRPKLTDLS
jgi:hypothetical protein